MRSADRAGFSLMEVLLATSIVVGSSIVLVELASIGRKHANTAEELATAQLLCQAKLNEMLAGLSPVAAAQGEPCDEDSDWLYSVEMEPLQQPGLVAVRVTVWRDSAKRPRASQFTLVRWIHSPNSHSSFDFATITAGRSSLLQSFRGGRRR